MRVVTSRNKSKLPTVLVAFGLLGIGAYLLMNDHSTSGGWCIFIGILVSLDVAD